MKCQVCSKYSGYMVVQFPGHAGKFSPPTQPGNETRVVSFPGTGGGGTLG